MKLKNVTLELSSKPFRDDSDETMRSVCTKLFMQWHDLTKNADVISVMLWLADGSEILNYSGDLNQTFEWAYWCGCANPVPIGPEKCTERQKRNTHHFPKPYIENPQPRTYAWLKKLVSTIKEIGTQITGKPIRVGETYDNGPEFAISEFKYKKHREICQGHTMYPNSVVTCTATLNADPEPYAGFPNGIPQGTSVGTFLGKQYAALAKDVGFDYLWLSNGMGFGTETWGITGMLFDKKQFYPEKAAQAAELMLGFWRDLYKAAPGIVIETRGSNFSAGVEISTDACPLKELYEDFKIAPPVNSPWAALNFNTGLEIAAWMSHVAELPDHRFPFRFYIHDPWFANSPWLDRYGREPWDLYPLLAVSRIDQDGNTQIPNSVAFLSADDTWGRLPDQVPREVIPHLYEAFNTAPDQPGPLLWLYPFDEYSQIVRGDNPRPDVVFSEDMFIGECIQEGTPLNTVISTGNFRKLISEKPHALDGSILIVPISATFNPSNKQAIETFIENKTKLIFYGNLQGAPDWLKNLLQLQETTPITGKIDLKTSINLDKTGDVPLPTTAFVFPQHSCGGICEILVPNAKATPLAFATQNQETRIAALARTLDNGTQIAFVKALLPAGDTIRPGRAFDYADKKNTFPTPRLLRHVLGQFGWSITCKAYEVDDLLPRTTISRNDNAFFFNIYAPNTTVEMAVNTPWGAPILTEMNTRLDSDGNAIWHPNRAEHRECRLFVKQKTPSTITAKIAHQGFPEYHDSKKRSYYGFIDAEIRFFVPKGYENKIEIVPHSSSWEGSILNSDPLVPRWEETSSGLCAVLENFTGSVAFGILK
ncbi:MAG: hypothetical protein GX561_15000 [Lentisphaerae bacterium]|nr:hypothetical protein [Lentisphaerota bacterium]